MGIESPRQTPFPINHLDHRTGSIGSPQGDTLGTGSVARWLQHQQDQWRRSRAGIQVEGVGPSPSGTGPTSTAGAVGGGTGGNGTIGHSCWAGEQTTL